MGTRANSSRVCDDLGSHVCTPTEIKKLWPGFYSSMGGLKDAKAWVESPDRYSRHCILDGPRSFAEFPKIECGFRDVDNHVLRNSSSVGCVLQYQYDGY